MMRLIKLTKKILRFIKRVIFRSKDHVLFSDTVLPAPDMRWCGAEFKDNAFYLQSAEAEARRLIDHFGCNPESRILDIGCGPGRLPIGLLRVIVKANYTGIDVDQDSIAWGKYHIQQKHPSFRFQHLNIINERYNKNGIQLTKNFSFEFPANSFDIIYLYSVFSHMYEEDMRIYLSEFIRILKDNGKIFFTTFAEENVPDVSVNPKNYVFKKCFGPLHVVRYEKNYIFSLLDEIGFIVEKFSHRTETHGQSAFYLRRK